MTQSTDEKAMFMYAASCLNHVEEKYKGKVSRRRLHNIIAMRWKKVTRKFPESKWAATSFLIWAS